jgi:hypothetical protein
VPDTPPDAELPGRARGHEPQYFDDPAIDQLHKAVLALAAELSVAWDRIDALERVLQSRGAVTPGEVDRYVPDTDAEARRAERRAALVSRVLRPFRQYREALIERGRAAQRDP